MTLAACSDFLEVQPRTQVSETEFYKTEDEMMKGLYNVMWEVKTRLLEIHDYSCILSDEAETGGGLGEGQWKTKWDTFSYNATSSFGQWGYGSWWNEWDFGIYNGVIAANILIDKLNSCSLDDSFVKPLKAEASFFRALSMTICLWAMSNSLSSKVSSAPTRCIPFQRGPEMRFMIL